MALTSSILSFFVVVAIASGDHDGKSRRAVTSDVPARINRPKHKKYSSLRVKFRTLGTFYYTHVNVTL